MYLYQCGHRKCRKRYRFPKPLEEYKRKPPGLTKDRFCGRCKKGYLNECGKHVRKWNDKLPICNCGLFLNANGLPMPHREGSKGCIKGYDSFCEQVAYDVLLERERD